jgi:hypothetical protein
MMIEFTIVIAICVTCLLSFFDFIIFNEEILLALCFLSFLFYCFNTLSESIFSSFESRAAKFEQDLLASFDGSKLMIINEFNNHVKLNRFVEQFSILFACLSYFIDQCIAFLSYKPVLLYFQLSLAKLNELVISNLELVELLNKSYVIRLLYSLLLNTTKNNLIISAPSLTQSKLNELKNISII